jgi:hypothetical protein
MDEARRRLLALNCHGLEPTSREHLRVLEGRPLALIPMRIGRLQIRNPFPG